MGETDVDGQTSRMRPPEVRGKQAEDAQHARSDVSIPGQLIGSCLGAPTGPMLFVSS